MMHIRNAFWLFVLSKLAHCVPETFDYIIVGGGTAGLTLAARLSEDADTTVAVLEAGEDRSEDVSILAPGLLTSLYGDPKYDWNYRTVPQKHANNHVVAHPRGKQLGGSSAINFLWWTHVSQRDINDWGLLGNANWTWDALEPFFEKSEQYVQPSSETAEALKTEYIDPNLHGRGGPIVNTFADIQGPLERAWSRAYDVLGLSVKSDPRDGLALGGYTNLLNLDLATRSRSYAANTYLRDARTRSNLKVVTGAMVQKLVFETSHKKPRATGVEYLVNDTSKFIYAQREIVLSAGAFGSPQLLELSGIGDPALLQKNNLRVIANNSNVGENLQDHAYVPLGFTVRPGIVTQDDFSNETFFNQAYEQYVNNRTGYLATTSAMSALLSLNQINGYDFAGLLSSIDSFCPAPRDKCDDRNTLPKESPLRQSILCSSLRHSAVVQEFAVPGGMSPQFSNDTTKLFLAGTPGNFLTLAAVLQHPFSHGSVHIASNNPSQHPTINPNYLAHPLDIQVLSAATLHLQNVAQASPLADLLLDGAVQPGYPVLDTANVEAWIRDNLQSEYHPCGTCAMLPRDGGGVVDERFRVYGVDGLRVVDASVFPLIPRANLQSLVYAVAERAAGFIREDRYV